MLDCAKALTDNMPYDEFARELITAIGNRYTVNRAELLRISNRNRLDRAAIRAQTFMGLSLECARCHDHPREKWKRADFLGLAAFFSQVTKKTGSADQRELRLSRSGKSSSIIPTIAKQVVPAKFPGEEPRREFRARRGPPRAAGATGSLHPRIAYFAPAIVNRVWKQIMGRGIVDPEDFRITNPPSHPELLKKLSRGLHRHGYNLRHLMKSIVTSRTYQLSAQVNETNQDDKTAYSHHYSRQLTAEQMLDAIVQVTG